MTYRKNIYILYSHYPHYRKPVFDLLKNSGNFSYRLFYGDKDFKQGIKAAEVGEGDVILRTYRIWNFIYQSGFMKYIINKDVDAIILLGNPYILSNWVYAAIARILGKRVIFWTHGWLCRERGLRGFMRVIYYRLSHYLFLYGERAKEIGVSSGFSPDKFYIIYNSLDYNNQRNIREKLVSSGVCAESVPFFLFVGRLTNEVGMEIAIRAIYELRTQGVDVSLKIVGDGYMRAPLEGLAISLGVNVQFLGESYDEEEIGRLMLSARAVVSPGKVGLLAMHALAYGTPVLTHGSFDSQMPEFEAIQDGVTGGFFRRDDPVDLARLMLVWIDRGYSSAGTDIAIQMIEKNYSPAAQSRKIEDALQEILSTPR